MSDMQHRNHKMSGEVNKEIVKNKGQDMKLINMPSKGGVNWTLTDLNLF